jgi:predicted metal-dependent phosphotriesterase family hydrolase
MLSVSDTNGVIRTVCGDVPADSVGHCQCHEHLFISKGRSFEHNSALWMDDVARSTLELVDYYKAGGRLVVDAQPVFFGRMAEALIKASVMSNVHIVASTGFHKMIFCENESFFLSNEVEALSSFFVNEVTTGMHSSNGDRLTGCAGIMKVALEKGGIKSTSLREKLFRASAVAAKNTGVPILIHMESEVDAFEVIRLYEEYDIDSSKLIFCHMDRTHQDAGYHHEVLSMGAYLNYDSIHRYKYISDEQERKLILSVLGNGYGKQLLLSLDTTRARLLSYGGEVGLAYLLTNYLPELKAIGIEDTVISDLTIYNARRALSF